MRLAVRIVQIRRWRAVGNRPIRTLAGVKCLQNTLGILTKSGGTPAEPWWSLRIRHGVPGNPSNTSHRMVVLLDVAVGDHLRVFEEILQALDLPGRNPSSTQSVDPIVRSSRYEDGCQDVDQGLAVLYSIGVCGEPRVVA